MEIKIPVSVKSVQMLNGFEVEAEVAVGETEIFVLFDLDVDVTKGEPTVVAVHERFSNETDLLIGMLTGEQKSELFRAVKKMTTQVALQKYSYYEENGQFFAEES